MIARIWTGVITRERQDEYVAYVEHTGVAEYRSTPGCRLSAILTRTLDDTRAEVTAFSVWDSEAHIQAFAGPNIDAMVLYPEDEAYLLQPPHLVHHDVPSLAVPTQLDTS